MRRQRERISSTHVDRHNEAMSLEALQSMASQLASSYTPYMYDHDPRFPTLGRAISGEVVELIDGHHALEVVSESWEPTDDAESTKGDGRRIPISPKEISLFEIEYDRSFEGRWGRQFVGSLENLADGRIESRPYSKKALEPVSTIVIAAGIFALGNIASGFFKKLGEYLWGRLRSTLSPIGTKKSKSGQLLEFRFYVSNEEHQFEVLVLVEEPTAAAIADLFSQQFPGLDSIVEPLVKGFPDLARVVIAWRKKRLQLLYALRNDAYPVVITPEAGFPDLSMLEKRARAATLPKPIPPTPRAKRKLKR